MYAPLPHVTLHTKHEFKDKIQNFRMTTASCWTKHGALLNAGPYVTAQVTCPWCQPFWSIKILCEVLCSIKGNNIFWTFSEPLLCLYASESPKSNRKFNVHSLQEWEKRAERLETEPHVNHFIHYWASWLCQYVLQGWPKTVSSLSNSLKIYGCISQVSMW